MYRLIYKSKSSGKIDKETIRDILYTSLDLNRKNSVTGALLATHTHFLQVLEGELETVNDTFFRIAQDPRHTKIALVSFGPVDKRLFDRWTMKGFGIFELNVDLEARLKVKYGEEEGGVKFPLEEWSCLSLVHDVSLMDAGTTATD